MKSVVVPFILCLLLSSGAAFADEEMYKTKNCFACHRIDKNHLGPSFQSVAAKYADDKGAEARLVQKIRDGSVGVWGPSPMPAQTQVTEAEALTLARWILGLK
ncbi:MAG: c-type cytochrome [Variovorax sp.]|nr:MAG: c-type cytochrome [Variovorax sp.]